MTGGGAPQLSARDIVRLLDLAPHPEGGHFRETFRDAAAAGRSHSTAIFYLLAAGERAHWHRVDAAEIWHHYCGAPLRLSLSPDGKRADHQRLGIDLLAASGPRSSFRRDAGRRRRASAHGRSSAAPWRPVSNSPASRWRPPASAPARQCQEKACPGLDPGWEPVFRR
jgi:hypothetical protein